MFTKNVRAGLVAVAAIGLAACAEAPEQAIQAVSTAQSEASAAGAETYAAEALQQAQDALNRAEAERKVQDEKFVLFRSYKDSEAMYNEAKAGFEAAKAAAVAGKEQAKGEATAAIEGAKAAVAAASEALANAPRTKDSKADLDLWKTDLETYSASIAEAEAAFGNEDYLGAKATADGVAAKAGEISTAIATAMEKVKSRRR